MPAKILYDFPQKLEDQLGQLKKLREEGSRWRDTWGARWDKNIGTIRGELWPDSASKPLFLSNLISPTVRRKAGLLVETKPGIDIRPRKNGLKATADVLKKTSMALWDEQSVSMALESLAYYLAAMGHGYLKITWDPQAEFGLGSIIITDIDPRLMLVDPSVRRAVDLWQAGYLIEESVVSLTSLRRLYPKTAKDLEASPISFEPGNEERKIGWFAKMRDRLKRQARGDGAIDRVYLQQFWVKDDTEDENGKLLYPGGRRILLANEETILNPSEDLDDKKYGQANPYWDGLWPYVLLDNEPDMDHPFGHPEVDALRKVNEAFNSVGHMTTRTMVKNVPWVIADQGALDSDSMQDLKELEEVVLEKAAGRSVERTPPTQPTATNLDFMRLMITLTEMYAGLNDGALQGKGRVELRSAPQLEGLQQSSQVLIRSQTRRLENACERAGQLLISRIFQFVTDDRLMVYNDNGAMKEFELQKNELRAEIIKLAQSAAEQKALEETQEKIDDGTPVHRALVEPELTEDDILEYLHGAWKLFRFKINPFSMLASTKMQRASMLEQLAEKGLIPGTMVVEEAGFDNADELEQKAAQWQQRRQQLGFPPPAAEKGKGKGGPNKK